LFICSTGQRASAALFNVVRRNSTRRDSVASEDSSSVKQNNSEEIEAVQLEPTTVIVGDFPIFEDGKDEHDSNRSASPMPSVESYQSDEEEEAVTESRGQDDEEEEQQEEDSAEDGGEKKSAIRVSDACLLAWYCNNIYFASSLYDWFILLHSSVVQRASVKMFNLVRRLSSTTAEEDVGNNITGKTDDGDGKQSQ
jgi:hypothetical protein